jgi:hypothetical protein
LADVFAIQSEIAKAIADQLQANLTGRLHGAESHRRQDEPGAIRLERRRLYPAEHYHDDRFKWSLDYLAKFACGFIRCLR